MRGMRDIVPEEMELYRLVEDTIRKLFELYGYEEVRLPTIENFELFAKKSGEEIRRSMYVFRDKAGREVALRPELTPSVARFFIEHMLAKPKPIRLGYIGNCFRYEEPQFARFREFWQGGFELFGSKEVEADVEVLTIAVDLMDRLGFAEIQIVVNNVAMLRELLAKRGLPDDEVNAVLSLLDKRKLDEAMTIVGKYISDRSFVEKLASLGEARGEVEEVAKKVKELFGDEVASHVDRLLNILELFKSALEKFSVRVDVVFDPLFARGLEYYTGMIFEVFVPGFPVAVAGGGRYDNLIRIFEGDDTPGVGFSPGIDRIVLAMRSVVKREKSPWRNVVYVVPLASRALGYAVRVAVELRKSGIPAILEVNRKRARRAMEYALDNAFRFVCFIGEREVDQQLVTLKDLKTGEQRSVSLEECLSTLLRECG